MTLPRHNNATVPMPTRGRKDGQYEDFDVWACAPYNFVSLPEKVIPSSTVDLDRFTGKTGWIVCAFTTKSPLYVRGMMLSDDYAIHSNASFHALPEDVKARRAAFHTNAAGHPIVPGSSLRGMIRSLVEIITFSKVQPVSKEPIVYRAVADGENTALGIHYKQQLDKGLLRAGYIKNVGGDWRIQPALPVQGHPFGLLRVAEGKSPIGETYDELRQRLNGSPWQKCQNAYAVNASGGISTAVGYIFDQVAAGGKHVLVVTDRTPGLQKSKKHPEYGTRKFQYILGLPDPNASQEAWLEIPHDLVIRYREQLSDAQIKLLGSEKSDKNGVLREDQPVFYLVDGAGNLIFFGHARFFRLPYRKSPYDLVPQALHDDSIVDMAEAMFGFVRSVKQPNEKPAAHAGRVFVEDAICAVPLAQALLPVNENQNAKLSWFTPAVLSGPKPTIFQHYLVQDASRGHEPNCKENLAFYDTSSPSETVIRGSKQYWHKQDNLASNDWQFQNGKPTRNGFKDKLDQFKTQLTGIKPIKPEVRFTFKVRFENLRDEELGALLWALQLPPGCKHKLGMGKPLGLGSVDIEVTDVHVSSRANRYASLFDGDHWAEGTELAAGDYKDGFEKHVQEALGLGESPFVSHPRIQELLKLLAYPGPDPDWTRYMEIERITEYDGEKYKVNEYLRRPVLPDPFHVESTQNPDLRIPKPCIELNPQSKAVGLVPAGPIAVPAPESDFDKYNDFAAPSINETPSERAISAYADLVREWVPNDEVPAKVEKDGSGNFVFRFGTGPKDIGRISAKKLSKHATLQVGSTAIVKLVEPNSVGEWKIVLVKVVLE